MIHSITCYRITLLLIHSLSETFEIRAHEKISSMMNSSIDAFYLIWEVCLARCNSWCWPTGRLLLQRHPTRPDHHHVHHHQHGHHQYVHRHHVQHQNVHHQHHQHHQHEHEHDRTMVISDVHWMIMIIFKSKWKCWKWQLVGQQWQHVHLVNGDEYDKDDNDNIPLVDGDVLLYQPCNLHRLVCLDSVERSMIRLATTKMMVNLKWIQNEFKTVKRISIWKVTCWSSAASGCHTSCPGRALRLQSPSEDKNCFSLGELIINYP